jgi:hypothetical protein
MSDMDICKRLVVCFGSIQLVTALSVLQYREQHQPATKQYKNYLVITPLAAPQGQDTEFADFIERMARSVLTWEKIIYISSQQKDAIEQKLGIVGRSGVFKLIYEQLGCDRVDEVYLAHNYGVDSRLLMNAYADAEHICYGNGIGIYTPKKAFPASNSQKKSGNLLQDKLSALQRKGQQLLSQGHLLSRAETYLGIQEFDIGYFSLASAFGETPDMQEVVTLDRTVYAITFKQLGTTLAHLMDVSYIETLSKCIQQSPTSILLTSNFSESAGRMSQDHEIAAYKAFLETQGIPDNSILIIKPHPRDSKAKITALKAALGPLYADIFELSDPRFFYLPFEILFMALFPNLEQLANQSLKIFGFSSACLTLEFLFDVRCTLGFGTEIVKQFFYPNHVDSRIEHESDLQLTAEDLRHRWQNSLRVG